MIGTFACPECGARVDPARVGKGRQVRCEQCSTLLEVPYFPRLERGRRRRKRPWWLGWALGTGALVGALVVVGVASWVVRSAARSPASAAAPKRSGPSPAEAESRVAAAEALEATQPAQALELYLKLLPELEREPDLTDLADRLRPQIARARLRAAEADVASARAIAATEPARALALAEGAMQASTGLAPATARPLQEQAQQVAVQVAESSGLVLAPVHGRFWLGTGKAYEAELYPRILEVARAQGYTPLSAHSPFQALWSKHGLYHLTLEVTEAPGDFYIQSRNRISLLEAQLTLSRAGAEVWRAHVSARTEVPLPNLRAYEANRLALAEKRKAEVEHRFYDNALAQLRNKVQLKLREFPARAAGTA